MTCTESSQKHLVQQQDHTMNRLMLAVEEDFAMVKDLAVAMDQLLVTNVEL